MTASCMQIRGFDSFDAKLGDEMRGERATLGKSFEDVGRDLRIEAQIIKAIEDCDHNVFPNRNVVAGYVRSYARYLRLDPDRCYRQFCRESGFKSPSAGSFAASRVEPRAGELSGCATGKVHAASRFADLPVAARATNFPIPAGVVFSFAALIVTLAGLGYAGYSVLQNIQRVGFVPAIEAPDVVAEAPEMTLLTADSALRASEPVVYGESGIKTPAGLNAKPRPGRDGPISEIDPGSYGAFAAIERTPENEATATGSTDDPIASGIGVPGESSPVVTDPVLAGVAVHAVQDVWIRIVNDSNVVLFQGVLHPGQSYEVPDSITSPNIHIGNAGGVYIRIYDNIYGPAGKSGQVIKGFPLTAEAIRANFPKVDDLETEKSTAKPEDRHATAIFR